MGRRGSRAEATASTGAEARILFRTLYAARKRRSSTGLNGFGTVGLWRDWSRALPGRGASQIPRGMGPWNLMSRNVGRGNGVHGG
jgi:hypothetical protein